MTTTDSFIRVLDVFRDYGCAVDEKGDRASIQAPDHSPADRSVSVSRIRDRTLIYSHSDPTEQVLAAVGLTDADLFDNPSQGVTYNYPDNRWVQRWPNKKIRPFGNTAGNAMYLADKLPTDLATTVYVTEGEQDADAITAAGGTAVSPVGGSNQAHSADWEPLRGRPVIVIADKDEVGRKHAVKVADALKLIAAKVIIVEAAVGKDAADHLTAGHGLDEFVPAESTAKPAVQIVTGDWLDAQTFPPMRWVIFGLIAEGLTILVGAPKLGKSWLVLSLALAVASGKRALGGIDTGKPRVVLYLALEDGHRRLQFRARQLLGDDPIPANLHIIIKGTRAELRDAIIDWLAEHRDVQPLVIVDTLGKLRPASSKNENAYEADYRFVGDLKALIDDVPGGAMVLVHHTNKRADGDFLDAVSGTQGIAGAADATITLRRARQEKTATLSVTGRDVMEAEYAITSEDGAWTLDGDGLAEAANAAINARTTADVGERMAQVVTYVNSRTETRAADLATHLDVEANMARTYLSRAANSERIHRTQPGVYTPVARVATVADPGEDNQSATHITPATPPHRSVGVENCLDCETPPDCVTGCKWLTEQTA